MNSNILFSLRNKQSRLFLNKELALKQSLERAVFSFRVSGIPFLVSEKGDIIFARPYGGIQGVQGFLWCVGEGLCPSRGRGNRRSAASGGCSEAISRKCPDWRPQQWPGIGWHDGGQENPAPTEGLQGVRCGEESPSHGFAVPALFRQGDQGDGGCGLPRVRCALAMTHCMNAVRVRAGDRKGRPYGGVLYKRCGERAAV